MTGELIFHPGDIVRLNDQGKAKSRSPDRTGVVLGTSFRTGGIQVHWRGVKGTQVMHRTFLELVEKKEAGGHPRGRGYRAD